MADQPETRGEKTKEEQAPQAPPPVEALWVAPFEAQLTDGTVLVPNETVVEVPEGEAKDSDYWKPVAVGSSKRKSKDGDD